MVTQWNVGHPVKQLFFTMVTQWNVGHPVEQFQKKNRHPLERSPIGSYKVQCAMNGTTVSKKKQLISYSKLKVQFAGFGQAQVGVG